MTIEVKIVGHIAYFRGSGEITFKDLFDANSTFLSMPNAGDVRGQIIDYTAIETYALNVDEVRAMGRIDMSTDVHVVPNAIAFAVSNAKVEQALQTYLQQTADSLLTTRIFHSVETAEDWLNQAIEATG